MSGRALHLHVGYGKTGSSYLQRVLLDQRARLAAAGITYPAVNGGWDSGNGALLLAWLAGERPLDHPDPPGAGALLLSREQLARELAEPGRCDQLARWAAAAGFAPVRLLLLVRDPQEHCYSLWAQKVKRAGEHRSLQEFAASYDAIAMAGRLLSAASAAGLEVQVVDYGRCRQDLLTPLGRWLGVSLEPRQRRSEGTILVNPTLTHRVLRLQRRGNRLLQRLGAGPAATAQLGTWARRVDGWSRRCGGEPRGQTIRLPAAVLRHWADQVQDFNGALTSLPGCDGEPMPLAPGVLRNAGRVWLEPRSGG